MSYSVLQHCNNGRHIVLEYANYGESFPNYYQARKFALSRNFSPMVVRSDRVNSVCESYKRRNN